MTQQFAPHQQRVLDEKRELDDKLQKLSTFISSENFSNIVQDEAERGRLVCQEEVMKDYSAILAERIEAFNDASQAEARWEQGKAPRVTQEMVNAQIAGETYTVLPSGRATVCELTLINGFTVHGESAVVFIENNVPATGREMARKKAVEQIWPLLGFRLRDTLAA